MCPGRHLLLEGSDPSEDGPDAGSQLFGINGLGQIILGPEIQAPDLVT
jgi:hypothetical protein